MKKILFLAMAAVAMVSCSQNEEIENAGQQAEIKFGTVVKASTKAAVISDLTGTDGFMVSAYNTGATTKDAVLSTAFIDNKLVSHSTGAWDIADGPYYWPLNDFVQFFAYAKDVNATNYVVASSATAPTVDYTVVAAAADQKDFVVAKLLNQQKATTAVTLPFTHALTQVNFSVKAKNAALKYVVTNVGISGLYSKGTYAFADGAWTNTGTADASYTYPISATAADVTVTGADAKKLDTTNGALMLMPQKMSADTKITISYNVYNGDTQIDKVENSEVSLVGKTDWVAGTNIRYTLELASEGAVITLNPEVSSWAEETPAN